jgi:hypothetical protein
MPSNPNTTALMSGQGGAQLYDPTCILKVDRQIAQGFVVLMAGASADPPPEESAAGKGKKKKKNKLERSALELGFMAITDGNIVDACFGVNSGPGSSVRATAASDHVKRIKQLLSDSADANDQIPRISVLTYQQAFRVVVHFHEEVAKLNFFTSCFKYGRIQHDAHEALRITFQQLTDAVESAL